MVPDDPIIRITPVIPRTGVRTKRTVSPDSPIMWSTERATRTATGPFGSHTKPTG